MTKAEFERYYRQMYMPLGMYALRLCGSVDEAEDIVQEAFVRAWEQIDNGREPESFKAYIYRIVRNTALTRTDKVFVSIDDMGEAVADEDIDTSERDAALWRQIDRLPERCRQVFLMSKRDGMRYADIAEELGISQRTVENLVAKAFSRLREAIEAHGGRVFFLPFL